MALKDRLVFQESVMHSFSHDFRAPIRRIRVRINKLRDFLYRLSEDSNDNQSDYVGIIEELDSLEDKIKEIGDDLKSARQEFNNEGSFEKIIESLNILTQPKMKHVLEEVRRLRGGVMLSRNSISSELVDEIRENASRINRMTLAIFDFIGAGERNKPRSVINVPKEFNRTVSDIDEFSNVEGVSINTSGVLTGRFEQFKLSLIFQNLIINSLKYRSLERVCEISLFVEVVDKHKLVRRHDFIIQFNESEKLHSEYAYLIVEDNGIGIPDNILPHVFELFTREDEIEERQKGDKKPLRGDDSFLSAPIEASTGVGLSIVKQLVNSMYGKIWITSEVDVGTKVHMLLPFER